MDEHKFYAYCLQGDVTSAYEYLRSIPDKSKKYRELEEKYYRRFFSDKPIFHFKTDYTWIRKVILAYYQYFISVLSSRNVREAETRLVIALQAIMPCCPAEINSLETKLEEIFNEKGYQFLGGVTAPFRGPYIWKNTVKKTFCVELPFHTEEVNVYFLSDFLMLSWVHFATFGKKYARGWAKEEGLFYVDEHPEKKKVNRESSEFQVSYLKHEAQHLSDYSRFPKLKQLELEYRAKLVELIYEPNPFKQLKKFYYENKNDPSFPHSYSSYLLLKRLAKLVFGKEETGDLEKWQSVESGRIREGAWRLFEESTKVLADNKTPSS